MAALLPYMEHQGLYKQLHFDAPWHDPRNWPAGRTLVPQFIDPSYGEQYRYVDHPDLAQVYGATHFVGVAGVGLDAGDPALGASRRGILGYERSASADEVDKERGLSNTMLMIRVPPDVPGTGVSPLDRRRRQHRSRRAGDQIRRSISLEGRRNLRADGRRFRPRRHRQDQ